MAMNDELARTREGATLRGGDPSGQLLAGRFVIERLLASGGMGAIYRGTDHQTGAAVAIKLLAAESKHAARLAREAATLAEFSHPAIVAHLAHGVTSEEEPFLVMEWLDGEDLAARLARLPLTLEQSVAALRRTCEGLAAVHARGVVHRDIKPSNLFLVNEDPSSLKLLDFGIARLAQHTQTLTQPGAVLGSVGYMSPEQAMGSHDVDARSDVFSLGCVLFECITGRPAFTGPNTVAVLAKILREEPFRVLELRPGVSASLDSLVARMLSKQPEQRPKDAMVVLRALDQLGSEAGAAHFPLGGAPGLTATEQRIVSVILGACDDAGRRHETRETGDAELSAIRTAAAPIGAEPIAMRDGGLLIVVSGRGAASDQAAQAASCALAVKRGRPQLRLSIATGRAETTGRVPVGAAIDRAAELLARLERSAASVAIDELTADLLPTGFQVQREAGHCELVAQDVSFEASRLLLGRPSPFVGRDKELALLDLTLRECVQEGVTRAVIVLGPPGQGKSRLRQEFVAGLCARDAIRVLIARGDPVGAGSSFGALRQLLRQALCLREGSPGGVQRAALLGRVSARCCKAERARVADFLGELIGLPPADQVCSELRAARTEPAMMNAWLGRSFCDWLEAECAHEPTLIVLEDLHWGDLPSVNFLGQALRRPSAGALMVLALARPELHTIFPDLWAGTEKLELSLGRLTRGAAKRMVEGVLGAELASDLVSRIVERADGNPFYLEELIRRAISGAEQELPETVLALVQSRLETLPADERWLARAASIFGEAFWRGGLAALLGASASTSDLDGWLDGLAQHEVIAPVPEGRFSGEREYTFRHGLFREAAYGMLTEDDRARGHALAGEWLTRAGETDALRLADHFELGRTPARAVPWMMEAAFVTLDAGDLDATLQLAERAASCGADVRQLGSFAWMRAAVMLQRGDLMGAAAAAQRALRTLEPGGKQWFQSAGHLFLIAAFRGDSSLLPISLHDVLSTPPEDPLCGSYSFAICCLCSALIATGQLDQARAALERTEALEQSEGGADPAFVVNLRVARGGLQLFSGELGAALHNLAEGRDLADRLELITQRALARYLLASALSNTGSLERTDAVVRELESLCDPRRMRFYVDRTNVARATVLIDAGRAEQAIALLEPLLASADTQLAQGARGRLAHALLARGDLDAASAHARSALEQSARLPVGRAAALTASACIALARGRAADALAIGDDGLADVASGIWPRDRSTLCLVRAEALHALARHAAAQVAIREARARVLAIQSTLADPVLRASYVKNVAVNARILLLAERWLGA